MRSPHIFIVTISEVEARLQFPYQGSDRYETVNFPVERVEFPKEKIPLKLKRVSMLCPVALIWKCIRREVLQSGTGHDDEGDCM